MMYNHHAAISAGQGAPVAWVKLDRWWRCQHDRHPENAPHPNAARLVRGVRVVG